VIFCDIEINIMLPTIISYAAILIAGASQTMVQALPQSSPTPVDCVQPNHESFTLSARTDAGDTFPLRLLVTDTTPEGSTAILSVNTDEVSPTSIFYHHEFDFSASKSFIVIHND
jgi:hypothetical protein